MESDGQCMCWMVKMVNTSQQELGGEKQISVITTGISHAFERFTRND
jgi:hypothetical protein